MRRSGAFVGLTLAVALVGGDSGAIRAQAPAAPMVTFDHAQTLYALHCGGCHGTLGLSPPKSVPVLRDRAGYFLCTPEARRYIVQLPNVSRARLDDEDLAALLNFITLRLGGGAGRPGAKPYTAEEIAHDRAIPLGNLPIIEQRRKIVTSLIRRCGAPDAMLDYGR